MTHYNKSEKMILLKKLRRADKSPEILKKTQSSKTFFKDISPKFTRDFLYLKWTFKSPQFKKGRSVGLLTILVSIIMP